MFDLNKHLDTQRVIDTDGLIKTNEVEEFQYIEAPKEELFKGWDGQEDYSEYLSKRRGDNIKDAPLYKMIDTTVPQSAEDFMKGEDFDLMEYTQANSAKSVENCEFTKMWQMENQETEVLKKTAQLFTDVVEPLLKKLEDDEFYFLDELQKGLSSKGVIDVDKVERLFVKMLMEKNSDDLEKKFKGFKMLVNKLKQDKGPKVDVAAEKKAKIDATANEWIGKIKNENNANQSLTKSNDVTNFNTDEVYAEYIISQRFDQLYKSAVVPCLENLGKADFYFIDELRKGLEAEGVQDLDLTEELFKSAMLDCRDVLEVNYEHAGVLLDALEIDLNKAYEYDPKFDGDKYKDFKGPTKVTTIPPTHSRLKSGGRPKSSKAKDPTAKKTADGRYDLEAMRSSGQLRTGNNSITYNNQNHKIKGSIANTIKAAEKPKGFAPSGEKKWIHINTNTGNKVHTDGSQTPGGAERIK